MRITNLKAIWGAIGATVTAVNTFLLATSTLVGDDAISFEEIGSATAALLSLVGTVYAVWKAPYQVADRDPLNKIS